MAPPLDGLTVLDLTRVLAGPFCTMQLADMGARVIKVEQPGRGDDTRAWGPPFVNGESAYFLSVNRNKKSVVVDFKRPAGRQIVQALAAKADVLVENFRPGTLARHGLAYADLEPRNPRLVYASISGFGQTGPRAGDPGYDMVMQAEGGLMSITGPSGGPPVRLGVAVADLVAGLYAAQGILLALLVRARTGRGQFVDVAMMDATASLLTYQAGIVFATGERPRATGNRHPSIAPYDTFATSDGTLVLAVGNDEQWRRFCAAAGLDELGRDERFWTNRDRVLRYDVLHGIVAGCLGGKSSAEWVRRLGAAGVPCGVVRSVDEVVSDPHLLARAMVEALPHAAAGMVSMMGIPVKLSETPGAVRTAPPALGQHTDAVLTEELGLGPDELAELRAVGAIR